MELNEMEDYFITENKSGWKCVEQKLYNHNHELYINIQSFITLNQNLIDLPFKQKIWHFIHNQSQLIKCRECDKSVKFLDIRRGYQKFCSTSCSNKNKEKIDLTKSNNILKWGVPTPFQNPEIYGKYKENLIKEYGIINIGQLQYVNHQK